MNALTARQPSMPTAGDAVLDRRRQDVFAVIRFLLLAIVVLAAFSHSGLLDVKRLGDAWPAGVAGY